MKTIIQTRRVDGRSNQRVIVDFVCNSEPGTTFTYEDLAHELSIGVDRIFEREDVQQIVRLAKFQLLREHKRTMSCIPNLGYRLAHARDHHGIAKEHSDRSQRQLRKSVVTLEHARLEEMTASERERHLAQCTINREVLAQQRRIASKQSVTDTLIARLSSRVEQLEAKVEQP